MAEVVRGGWALLMLALCAGCGLDLNMIATPDPVVVGSPLTYRLSVTNLASCAIDQVELFLYPLADDDDPNVPPFCRVAAEHESEAELAPPGTVSLLDVPSFSHQPVQLMSAESSAGAVSCSAPDGSQPIMCQIGSLDPDQRVKLTIVLTATRPGTFADVAIVAGLASAECHDQGAIAMDTICGETTVIDAPAAPLLSASVLVVLALALLAVGLWRQRRS